MISRLAIIQVSLAFIRHIHKGKSCSLTRPFGSAPELEGAVEKGAVVEPSVEAKFVE